MNDNHHLRRRRHGHNNQALVGAVTLVAAVAVLVTSTTFPSVDAARTIRFASPLTSLTIPDRDVVDEADSSNANAALSIHRNRFLPKWMAGLKAEKDARTQVAANRSSRFLSENDVTSDDWASRSAAAIRRQRQEEDRQVEKAYDDAVQQVEQQQQQDSKQQAMALKNKMTKNKYQFVGVIDNKNRKNSNQDQNKVITWYARPKPPQAKWSVRLVHVNQDAIIKDLFARGKIDIFAKYTNAGIPKPTTTQTTDGSDGNKPQQQQQQVSPSPVVKSRYDVRQRSWRNLWNFSPKHYFTDSSGMYWRERRLPNGLYTDGVNVYESSYRYKDGRNGMHPVSTLQQYLSSKSITDKEKSKIMKKLQSAAPDIVLEL